jgi:hypothetical protein
MSTVYGLRRSARSQVQLSYQEPPLGLLLFFMVYVVYLYLELGFRYPMLGDIRAEFIMGLILGPIAIGYAASRRTFVTGSVLKWSIAFLLVMLLMVPLSVDPAFSWNLYWNRALKFAIYGFAIAAFCSSPRALRWFIAAWLLAFFKMAEEGFIGTITGGLIWENQEIPRLHGTTPDYNQPNSFSGTQLSSAPFLWYLYPLLPWYYRIYIAVHGIFCFNAVLRTGSRTGYVATVIGTFALAWTSANRKKAITILVIIALVAIPLLPAAYTHRFESIYEDKSAVGAENSVGQRKEILVDATKVFLAHPLGIGVGAFPIVRAEVFGRTQDTHNLYLEVATNLGVQGLIIFFGFVVCLWKTLRGLQADMLRQIAGLTAAGAKGPEVDPHLEDLKFMRAMARATWLFLVIRLALGLFGMDTYEVYWWFMSGLAISLLSLNETALAKTQQMLASHGAPALEVNPARAAPRGLRRRDPRRPA